MLRAWVTPVWALLGGLLAAIEFGPLTSWINSYWGGFVSAIAGCLVFGSLPRLKQSPQIRNAILLGAGIGLQILTRPFEALFLTIAAIVYLLLTPRMNWKAPAIASAVVMAAVALTGIHNRAVTGNWLTMPYMESRYQYGVPATLTFQPNAVPHRAMTAEQDLDYRAQAAVHGPGTDSIGEYCSRLLYRFRFLRFFFLPPLYFAFIPFILSLRERRYAWLSGTILLFVLGTNVYPYFYPQYVAALTCVFVLISLKGLQRFNGAPRRYVALSCVAGFVFWFGIYASGDKDLWNMNDLQSWYYINRGDPQGRESVEQKLAQTPGQHLVFVRYSAAHRFSEWIHNKADIDGARTVWANDQGPAENEKLVRYYPARKVWLLEPDAHPVSVVPYLSEPPASPFETVH
jgi:4-amino-4-deoxy-L-arabinose transferase-like glycosyltransferase